VEGGEGLGRESSGEIKRGVMGDEDKREVRADEIECSGKVDTIFP